MSSQQYICTKFDADYSPCSDYDKLGIAIETIGKFPINGLRHVAENGTCGWYIWCGEEWSDDPDFFKPLHVSHIDKYLPEVQPYLALPPGYRFLVAESYEDVWQDLELIDI
ncbi:hypothetical protein CXF83_08470 [Shewanella sp. Choline-02u-19]|uniref:immunity protein Imm33 domain-containing protein n=1 Tax=unclassified Shewanella TaxID=196818 RepID=UPI000C33F2AB|nr:MULTISPECIES: hypothetical protein [unclassified Shewanella]PKH54995.1 hypothetical protein CXF84_19450 [Shewanella sp. Bg11-22]PKI26767.1 hypothetical protein CXF83_08470 [Shewanella sp. Choline-02u-19]